MMWGYDFGWGGMLLMSFGGVLWIALLVVLVWAVIRWLERRTTTQAPPSTGTPSSNPSALDILHNAMRAGRSMLRHMSRCESAWSRRTSERTSPSPLVVRAARG